MNNENSVLLKDLCGFHKFQGIEVSMKKNTGFSSIFQEYESCQVVKIMLDNTTYEAMEDPDDGYRSFCDYIIISDDMPRYTFPDYEVFCKMKPNDRYDEHEVLIAEDPNTGLTIFEIGTLYVNDYYPCWHFEYHPENMRTINF
jgi:hypothetical protein